METEEEDFEPLTTQDNSSQGQAAGKSQDSILQALVGYILLFMTFFGLGFTFPYRNLDAAINTTFMMEELILLSPETSLSLRVDAGTTDILPFHNKMDDLENMTTILQAYGQSLPVPIVQV